jgi:predicted permease
VFRRKFPGQLGPNSGFGLSVEPVRDVLVRDAQRTLLVLSGAVALVLLIACANVANLLLIRANGRRREFAIRASLGAGRGRIARQLLGESVMLSLAGGVLGLLLGMLGIRALLAIDTAGLPRIGTSGALVGVDWRVVAYTMAVSLGTGVLFGLVPAWHASRSDLTGALKESSGRSGTGFRQNKARAVLVVSEVALALVLLIGSALLIRTAYALSHVDPGFDTTNVLTVRTSLSAARFKEPGAVEQTVKEGVERLRAIPGVTAASASFCVPLQGCYGLNFDIVGKPADGQNRGSSWITTAPGYFDVFKIPIKRGRVFTDRDDSRAPGVAIINEAMAKAYWPNADPLNDSIWIGQGGMTEFKDEPQRQIVGIVGDTRDGGLNSEPFPTMYTPQAQVPAAVNELNLRLTPFAWLVRTQGDPAALSESVQEQVRQVTGQPINGARAMDEVVRRSISRERFNMWLMTLFGGSALLLAAIGIYGLMAYSVQQRTQELGIRQALGADSSRLRRMVVRQGMRLTLVGVVIGMAAAFGLARLMAALLFGVGATDPLVFVGVPLLLSAVAMLAVWVPARRASAVDPIEALRYE